MEMPFSIKLVQDNKANSNIYAGLAPVIPLTSFQYINTHRLENKTSVNLSYFVGIGVQLPFRQKDRVGLELRYCRYLTDNYAYETASPGSTRNFTITNNASTFDWAITYKFR
jgi:opacity protein-like surface antigen